MQGQDIGSIDIERDPKTTDLDEHAECTDNEQKVLLGKSKRGREMYIYPENQVVVGNMRADVRAEPKTNWHSFSSPRFSVQCPLSILIVSVLPISFDMFFAFSSDLLT